MRLTITKLCFLLLILVPTISIGQIDFCRNQPDAQSIGVGGSGVALASNPSACYWNPASIAFLTTNRVLLNVNEKSYLNHIGLTRFFPPSLALGFNYFRFRENDSNYDIATIAMAYRLLPFLSLGTNFNFSKTMRDRIYSSMGVGLFFRTVPDYQSSSLPNPSLWSWLRSRRMQGKLSMGIVLHNYALNDNTNQHEVRVAVAIKPHRLGPLIHFASHFREDQYSLRLGTITPLSRHTDLYFGVKDLNINEFMVGGAVDWGPFELNLSYDFKLSHIFFSFLLRLGEPKRVLFQKYKSIGDQQIKINNYSGALKSYLKAKVYDPGNQDVNYLISVLRRESRQTSQKIDSLFVSAETFEKKRWYISAFITYRKILEIDEGNRKAKSRLKALHSKLDPYLNQIFRQGVIYYNDANLKRAQLIFKQILLVNKNHEGAKSYLARIDSINTSTANEYYYRGLGYYNQGNLSRAQQEFKEALSYKPDHQLARDYLEKTNREIETNNLLINRYLKEAKNYEQRKQYVKASMSYRKILEIDKSNQHARERLAYLNNHINREIDTKFKRARRLYDRMDYSGAITILQEILSINPDYAPAKNYLRRANQKLYNLAEQHFQRAQNFFNQKKWDMVLQECNLTLEMNPNHSAARQLHKTALENISIDKLLEKGLRYYQQGNYLAARSTFQQVLDKEPGNARAKSYVKNIDTELGIRIDELFNMGMEKYADGDYEQAIKLWKKILDIDPNHQSARKYIQNARDRIEALKGMKK